MSLGNLIRHPEGIKTPFTLKHKKDHSLIKIKNLQLRDKAGLFSIKSANVSIYSVRHQKPYRICK